MAAASSCTHELFNSATSYCTSVVASAAAPWINMDPRVGLHVRVGVLLWRRIRVDGHMSFRRRTVASCRHADITGLAKGPEPQAEATPEHNPTPGQRPSRPIGAHLGGRPPGDRSGSRATSDTTSLAHPQPNRTPPYQKLSLSPEHRGNLGESSLLSSKHAASTRSLMFSSPSLAHGCPLIITGHSSSHTHTHSRIVITRTPQLRVIAPGLHSEPDMEE